MQDAAGQSEPEAEPEMEQEPEPKPEPKPEPEPSSSDESDIGKYSTIRSVSHEAIYRQSP